MKIKKYVNIDTEIEVDINADDFLSSIGGNPDYVGTALNALNRIAELLKAISEETISKFNGVQRDTICNFLRSESSRYENKAGR